MGSLIIYTHSQAAPKRSWSSGVGSDCHCLRKTGQIHENNQYKFIVTSPDRSSAWCGTDKPAGI